ncbi:hypothetical protein HN011_007244, partial [Eciton burchellii]
FGIEIKPVGNEISKISKPTTRQASASRVGAESDTDDTSRVLDDTSSAEILILLMHSVNQLIRRLDENREEFRVFKKTYDMDRKGRGTTKDTTLRDDILSIAQAVKNFRHDIRNLQENMVTVKHGDPQVPLEIDKDRSSNQIETAIRPDNPSLEDAAPISRQGRQPTLRDILTPVPQFDSFNISLSQFNSECREVETAVSLNEETNVLILLRGKLRGRALQALQGRHFASVKQFIDRLQTSFGVSRNSYVWYTELENLSLGRRETIAAYIQRAQVLYDNCYVRLRLPTINRLRLCKSRLSRVDLFTSLNCHHLHSMTSPLKWHPHSEVRCLSSPLWSIPIARAPPLQWHLHLEALRPGI